MKAIRYSAHIQPDVRPRRCDGVCYQLFQDWKFKFEGVETVIPKRFKYDGATVPRWLWSITGFRPDGIGRAAALEHDWLYRDKKIVSMGGGVHIYSRRSADKHFEKRLIEYGYSWAEAKAQYLAVRWFGKKYWDS